MGLSRNKVAVSEGAAGSPPFSGEHERLSRVFHSSNSFEYEKWSADTEQSAELIVVQFSVTERHAVVPVWGCSSAGRAPALQAGGHGFDSHHLHQARSPGGQISRGDFRNRFGITRWDENGNDERDHQRLRQNHVH